jgi:hypothetical protein
LHTKGLEGSLDGIDEALGRLVSSILAMPVASTPKKTTRPSLGDENIEGNNGLMPFPLRFHQKLTYLAAQGIVEIHLHIRRDDTFDDLRGREAPHDFSLN